MVHLTNTSRSATFLIGIGILMLFFFCAPTLAQSSQGFKSTSAYQINASVQTSAVNADAAYQPYRSTIYSPFTGDAPSSGGPSRIGGRRNSEDEDDDVGIPGWADTPSEPLPIGDTAPLFLFAAAMIAIIWIRQRKQKQLTTQSQSTNNNDNTQHMTTRKQTYQSFFQKLFLLLVFVCIAGNTFAWKPIMIGHRGSRSGVENTKDAFINGIKNHGFKALECDVKVTADKKYICWHDDNIANSIVSNRDFDVSIYTNNLAGLQGLTLAQSRKNTITGTTTQYTGVICTLQEFLQICKDYNVTPIVEIKYNLLNIKSDGSDFSGLSDIYNIIANLDMLDKTVVLGTETMMEYYKNNHPNIQRMWLTNSITDAHITRCQELGCWIDSQPYLYYDSEKPANNKAITAAQIKKCQNAGVKVGLWTLNGTSSYNTYGAMGPNFITSDDNVVKDLPDLTGTDPNAPTTDKTIYFRPSTTNFGKGYTNHTTEGSSGGWSNVYWAKNGRLTASVHGNLKGSIFLDYEQTKNNTELIESPESRFIPITVPTGYTGVIAYRIGSMTEPYYINWKNSSGAQGVDGTKNTDISNTIPKFTNTVTEIPAPETIPTDGKNLLCNREGWWDVWYWAYYLPTTNTVTMYFANTSDWENVKLVTGKDIYTHETAPTTATIPNTKLSYFNLNGKEFGYEYYGFSGNGTTWDNSKTIPVVGGTQSGWVYDESSSFSNNKTTTAKNSNANQNRIANRIKYANNRTGLLGNLLKGANLYIPGAQDAKPTHKTLSSWQDLNHKQTVTSSGGGSVTISSYKLNNVSSTISTSSTISSESSTSIQAAYTATVTLTATPAIHCKFLGWYDKDWNELSTSLTYTYAAPNEDVIIHAIFGSKKKFRMQIFENKSETSIYDKNDWTDSNQGGTLTFSYTKTNSTTYTETIDDANQHPVTDIYPTKTLTITATPKSDYIFVGFWNNLGYPVTTNPWNMTNPGSNDESVTARFAKIFQQKVYAYTYNAETDVFDAKGTSGGSVTIEHPRITSTNAGCEQARVTTTGEWSDNVLAEKTTMTITASAADGYEFLGWYSTAGEPIDWMNEIGAEVSHTANAAYTIVARFHKPFTQNFDVQTEIGGQYQNSTTGGTATITYNNTTTNLTDQVLSISNMEQGTMVTLKATPNDGYRFVGWYNNSGNLDSSNPTYTYRAEGNRTVHARFARNDVQLVVAVMNYNTDYAEFVEYPHDNNTVTIANGGNTTTVTSSTSAIVNYGSQVTLTANNDERDDGYDFIGWYQNNKRISQEKSYTFTITDHSAISAHFAPKKCHKVILYHTLGGQYQVKYARPELFDSENGYYVANSLYNKDTTIFVPYEAKLTIIASTAKPTIGYKYTGYYRISKVTDAPVDGVYTIKPTKTAGGEENTPEVFVEFIRTEDQIVYLDLTAPNAREDWKNRTQYFINVRNIARKAQEGGVTAANIELTKVKDGLYSGTIPGNIYTDVTFYYEDKEGDFKRVSTTPQVIPATRNNCFILNGVYSSTDGWIDGWTTLDTENGDYRLIYREQTVVDKNNIRVDYEFNEGDRIKKRTTGTDIVSLHIYNKVSSDGVNGINNPEVILQQWSDNKDAWVDVERYMVFGPLRSNDASVIKMPNRKNTANEVVRVDLGINNIMTDTTDNGCGVWNFVIEQDGTTARLLVDETRRYEGNYYIRTTNADGQYNNFTHPNNVMTYSEYAKKNSDFSHYFVRYIDIYEDGTPTATAGKHPVVKFTIANDHAMFLCKELMINNNRFTDDEYGDDLFVKNVDGAPNLPVDATVRFGWDIVTNRLTRAYIANTDFKNNEYLVVEGTNITDISGNTLQAQDEATYFNENGDFFYQIDVKAKVGATANVKAKYNGKYQYFMGSEGKQAPLLSGSGSGTYPVRILYDFKNDRFMTFCELEGNINGTVALNTSVMIMREHNDPPTRLTFDANASVTATTTNEDQYTKPAYAVMTFLEDKLLDNNVSKYEKMFYWISFPFDVKISDVFGLGDYGKYWIMEEYDGKQRSQNGLAQTNWKYITKKSAVLKQNVGYVLCLNYSQILQDQLFKSHGAGEFGHSKLSLYFPSNSVISPAMLKGGQEQTIELAQYENSGTAWNHHNWHLIGVPSFATPGFDSKQDDVPFLYQYWHPGDAYAAVTPNEVTFHAMHSFMVQYYGNITWTSVVNATSKSLAAKKDADADKKIMLRLELQQADSTIDKTYVQLRNDKGTKGFDMSLDLTKIINAGANIYSIVDNHEMAGNAIPKEESIIPLGVVITAAGEYTFAMPNGTEGMMVELIDYEQGTSTNLLVGDYTVNIPVGTNNTRFALRMKPDKVATSVEDITSGTNDTVRKLLIDGVLYLQKGNTTYDAQGHVIR